MLSTAVNFAFCMVSFYSIYLAIDGQKAANQKLLIFHGTWAVYSIGIILSIVWVGSSVGQEVSASWLIELDLTFILTFIFICRWQSKNTGVILHRIVNKCCNEYTLSKVSAGIFFVRETIHFFFF